MAKTKTTQTKKSCGVTVIFSEDAFLVSSACEKMLDNVLQPDQRAMALYEPRTDRADITDVLDELRTLPFLAPKRVVLIKDAEPFIKANTEVLENYLNDPSPSGLLIMTVTAWDKRTRFHKKLQKAGGLVEIDKMKPHQMSAYVAGYAQRAHDIRLNTQCGRLLVELVGDDPGRLCREMDKLAMFVAPKKTVTIADVEQLIGKNRMFGAFEVIDAINTGQIAQALNRLRNMFDTDRDSEYKVVGAFSWHFRRLFRAKAYMEKGTPPQQAANKAGVFGYRQQDFLRQAAQMTLPQLANIMAELGNIDFGIKTGQTTAPTATERLITNVFMMRKRD